MWGLRTDIIAATAESYDIYGAAVKLGDWDFNAEVAEKRTAWLAERWRPRGIMNSEESDRIREIPPLRRPTFAERT